MRLANGVINAIGAEVVEELSLALQEVQGRFRGMVLAGGNKFFSIGLDLPELLLKLGRKDMAAFWAGLRTRCWRSTPFPYPRLPPSPGTPTAGAPFWRWPAIFA